MKPKKYLKLLFITFSMFCGESNLYAQEQEVDKPIWTEEQWQQAKDGIDYSQEKKDEEKDKKEDNKSVEEDDSDNDVRSDNNMGEWLNDFFSSPLVKIITICIIVVLLIVTIFFLMKSTGKKDNKLTSLVIPDLDNPDENIEETDLDRFLRLSLEAGDYNTAIRVLYLTSLQSLHIGKWLVWQKDKTNQDYLTEMRSQKNYGDFREITYIYEVVWYGDQKISAEEFNQLKYLFDKFLETIKIGIK